MGQAPRHLHHDPHTCKARRHAAGVPQSVLANRFRTAVFGRRPKLSIAYEHEHGHEHEHAYECGYECGYECEPRWLLCCSSTTTHWQHCSSGHQQQDIQEYAALPTSSPAAAAVMVHGDRMVLLILVSWSLFINIAVCYCCNQSKGACYTTRQ